jgi:hypothetical protein
LKSFLTALAFVPLLAFIANLYNTHLQNKQHLFNQRLSSYEFIMSLKRLIDENYDTVLKQYTDINLTNELNFQFLTNNSSLSKIQTIMKNPQDTTLKNNFLTMLETFDEEAIKQKFIFPKGYADIFSDFISSYRNELHSLYTYQILLKKGEEHYNSDINADKHLTIEKCYENIEEPDRREHLNAVTSDLEKAYSKLENLSSKRIEKQIRLFNPLISKINYLIDFKIMDKIKNSPVKND